MSDDPDEDDSPVYEIGEVWNVLADPPGAPDFLMLLREDDGQVHGWWDDASIFDYFEKIDAPRGSGP